MSQITTRLLLPFLFIVASGPAHAAAHNNAATLGHARQLLTDGDFGQVRKLLTLLTKAPAKSVKGASLRNRDYALYLLAQAELLDGAPSDAAAHFAEVAKAGGRFAVVARWRYADALAESGNAAEAVQHYRQLLPSAGATAEVDAAPALFHIAELAHGAERVQAFRRLAVTQPLHPLAAVAVEKMAAAEGALTAADHVARAKLMTANRAWREALDELALVSPGPEVTPSLRDETDYAIGMTHFHMRHGYDIAAQKLLDVWSRLPGDDRKADALFHGARARSRNDQDDLAIVGYRDVVARFPRTRAAYEASFLIGWLEFNRGAWAPAIKGLSESLARYPSTPFSDDARWYLALSHWFAGELPEALDAFTKLSSHPGALYGGKAAYWRGRTLDALHRSDEAQVVWRQLANDYPFAFYAQLARLQLARLGHKLGPFADGDSARRAPLLGAIEPVLTHDPLVARVDELLSAGLAVDAGIELRRGESAFIKKYTAARALPVLFDRYQRGEDFHRPHLLAEAHGGAALKLDPRSDETVRAWWSEMYPRAYRDLVEKYAATGNNPTYYLYTIMQKESAYDPHDVSYADAIGLLQMIPPTSRRVAVKIDHPFTDDVLYTPAGNIQFGAWYIGHLLEKFRGQIALGAGSYNAGPKAMMKWIGKNGSRPLDEFVELCPYTQTREYMKKVLDIYARYVYLYEGKDELPSLTIDPAFLTDDGIDY